MNDPIDDPPSLPVVRIFLSYARRDDEPFVRRLYEGLKKAGFDVWFDGVSMPSRRLSFHQEIRDSIAAHDHLVLVVGPEAVRSDYVTREWRFAYFEAGICVNPIVRPDGKDVSGKPIDGYSLIPEDLRLIPAEDSRKDEDFDTHLRNLIPQLNNRWPRVLLTKVLERTNYVARDVLKQIREEKAQREQRLWRAHELEKVSAAIKAGRFPEAIQAAEAALAEFPNDTDLMHRLQNARRGSAGAIALAREHFPSAIRVRAKSVVSETPRSRRKGRPEVPFGNVDSVSFSVTSPPTVAPGTLFVLYLLAFWGCQRHKNDSASSAGYGKVNSRSVSENCIPIC